MSNIEVGKSVLNCFTNTLVMASHELNACPVFPSQKRLRTTCVCLGPRPHDQLDAKDPDMGKALLPHDVTTTDFVK